MDLTVVICTLGRPHLDGAIEACVTTGFATKGSVEVVVVDNHEHGAAREVVAGRADYAPIPVRYVHEPVTNVSRARNAGVAAACAPLVAFIDDDMRPASDWADRVLALARISDADLLFGAVVPVPEDPDRARTSDILQYFARELRLDEGAVIPTRGDAHIPGVSTANCTMRRRTCLSDPEPFDPAFGVSGGEDTDLFQRCIARGAKAVWSRAIVAYEIVSPARATWPYVRRQQFRGSQNYARSTIKNGRSPLASAIRVATVGIAQAAAALPGHLAVLATGGNPWPGRIRLARAYGKILWRRRNRGWWEAAG